MIIVFTHVSLPNSQLRLDLNQSLTRCVDWDVDIDIVYKAPEQALSYSMEKVGICLRSCAKQYCWPGQRRSDTAGDDCLGIQPNWSTIDDSELSWDIFLSNAFRLLKDDPCTSHISRPFRTGIWPSLKINFCVWCFCVCHYSGEDDKSNKNCKGNLKTIWNPSDLFRAFCELELSEYPTHFENDKKHSDQAVQKQHNLKVDDKTEN